MFPEHLLDAARSLLDRCRARTVLLATAESCTGGLLAGLLTEFAGSSAVFERGYVTYSNEAKRDALGVPAESLETHGAVSVETARAMAEGALSRSRATLALSITGIAGPGGGTAAKPVGLVCFGLARRGTATRTETERFGDLGRTAIRDASLAHALAMIAADLDRTPPGQP